jgi:acyl-CoA dehydrogenase
MRAFVATELRPHADRWERDGAFPTEVFARLAAHGWLGLALPPERGGAGDPVSAAVLVEELARCGSGGLAAGIGAHTGIALPPIAHFGGDLLAERYVRPGIRGELVAALAITEPEAGSDVASLRTRAEPCAGGYRVSGTKTFITGGMRADIFVTAARTTPGTGHDGVSLVVVERSAGVHTSALQKLGWHASDTATVAFDEAFVPEENLLGNAGRGFALVMANFAWERLLMALGAVGAIDATLERALADATRHGRPSQSVRHRLASVAVTLETTRAVTYAALRRHVAGLDATRAVVMAKLATQRAAVEAIDTCLQIHADRTGGGDPELERGLRDARLGPIGGGTDEIMREILGRSLGL